MFIALFNESKGIKNTLDWFSKFLSSDVQLVLVTTEKETRVFGENKTLQRINSLLSLSNYASLPITVVNYPFLKGNKGAQLNYAIRQLDKLMPDDSRIIQTTRPNVIQQSSLYIGNYDVSSPYMKVEALFESIRAMGLERRNYLLKKAKKRGISPFCYCVGHGMCFRVAFLKQIGLFPEPNEDVPIGIKVALLGESIEPMVTKDYCNVTNSVKMLFFQAGNWIKAPFVCMITLYFFLVWLVVKIVPPELQIFAFRKKYADVQITYKEVLLAPCRDLFRGLAVFALILHAVGVSYNEMGRDDD